jgi:hypothetical protein
VSIARTSTNLAAAPAACGPMTNAARPTQTQSIETNGGTDRRLASIMHLLTQVSRYCVHIDCRLSMVVSVSLSIDCGVLVVSGISGVSASTTRPTLQHCSLLSPHCTALHCTALHCTALHCTVPSCHYNAPCLHWSAGPITPYWRDTRQPSWHHDTRQPPWHHDTMTP